MAFALPPVAATAYVLPAPTMNLSRKSGVLFVPSHKSQPVGMEAILPYHMVITPVGMMSRTKAVVAICVLSVLAAAVGAVGVPVRAGEADRTTEPVPVEVVTPVPPLATGKVPDTSADKDTDPHVGAPEELPCSTWVDVPAKVVAIAVVVEP